MIYMLLVLIGYATFVTTMVYLENKRHIARIHKRFSELTQEQGKK